MELKQLEYFIETVRAGSMTRAGEKLAITQPALSQQIQNLEREIGYELLERGPRGLTITPKGKIFLEHAVEVLDAAENLVEAARSAPALERLVIFSGQTVSSWVLPSVFYALKKERPELFLEVREGDGSFVKNALLSGEADLAITTEQLHGENIVSLFLCKDLIGPAISIDHANVPKSSGKPGRRTKDAAQTLDLLKKGYIAYHSYSAIQKITERMLLKNGLDLRKIMEVRSLAAMVKNIEAGNGAGFISSLVKSPGLIMPAIPELTHERKFYLAYRKKRESRFYEISRKIASLGNTLFNE